VLSIVPEDMVRRRNRLVPIPATRTNVAANRVERMPVSGLKILSASDGFSGKKAIDLLRYAW
jgi:hypothetical protein